MYKLTRICVALCLVAFGATLRAQTDDSRYLAGAVPEVGGKVVFSKQFTLPQLPQQDIYNRMAGWLADRLAQNENNSRVVYTNEAEGQIVGTGDEWIVFSSSALSLDRTRILYQVTVECAPGACTVELGRIRYIYREGDERYDAEEWITDKYALNKSGTKLVRGLAKWRRKTVDFADTFFADAGRALGIWPAGTAQAAAPQAAPTPVAEPVQQAAAQPLRSIDPAQLPADAIRPDAGKLVVVIGDDPFNQVVMTANAGGSLGKVDGKPVVFVILSPDQAYAALEAADAYTVRFYPDGASEPSLELTCRRHEAPQAIDGMPRTYVGTIIQAQAR